ncbi:hypothetical protein R6Q57_017872 [Mikania cordata]
MTSRIRVIKIKPCNLNRTKKKNRFEHRKRDHKVGKLPSVSQTRKRLLWPNLGLLFLKIPKLGMPKKGMVLPKDTSRTVDQIYSKWGDLNAAIKKWNGFYQQASMSRKSGEADNDVLKKTLKDCKKVVKSKGFPHMSAWELVRDSPLWCDIPPAGCPSQSTTKRSKPDESMGSANAQMNLDKDDDVGIQHDRDGPRVYYEPDRPVRKGKRSAASSSSHEELIQQIANFNSINQQESQHRNRLREEKLRALQEEKDARIALMRRQQEALDEQQRRWIWNS